MPFNVVITFDFDHRAAELSVEGVSSPIANSASLPAGIAPATSWLPDLALSEVAGRFGFDNDDFSGFIDVTDEDGNVLAWIFVYLIETAGSLEGAAGIVVEDQISLGQVPLLGPLLSEVSFAGIGVGYASEAISATTIVLPAGAPAIGRDLPQGLSLDLALVVAGSTRVLQLPQPSTPSAAPAVVTNELVPVTSMTSAAAANDPAQGIHWYPVDFTAGPLSVQRIGLVAASGTLGLAFDAELSFGAVGVALEGLTASVATASLSAGPTIDLEGLGIAVSSGPVELAGSLRKVTTATGVEYDGDVVMHIGRYGIAAVGSYATVAGTPSLFVFGMAQGEFGGPPAFFVTGLAAGFGANRALRLPTPDQVLSFPLLAIAQGGASIDIKTGLNQLNSGGWVPPQVGESWLAAGVAFRSFEIIDGFAVLSVAFGRELTVSVLGFARLTLPTPSDVTATSLPTFARAEATLDAKFQPADGSLVIEALLTPNSFVIDPACRLTGGLALCLWFAPNKNAGDFVYCLGGYHPLFDPPPWYPSVPRLGFSWHLSDVLQITGDSYFAITPSCAMAGGKLSVAFHAGPLRAWFDAKADLIMFWRPFWFEADIAVSIGASFNANLGFAQVTLTVEVGVSLALWGPPVQGIAHVNWWVISFDIPINGGHTQPSFPSALPDWSTFETTSLPQGSSTMTPALMGAVPPTGSPAMCQVRAAAGLKATAKAASGEEVWVFNGDTMALTTECVVPSTQIGAAGPAGATWSQSGPQVFVYPMGGESATVVQTCCFAPWTGSTWQLGQPLPAAIHAPGLGWTAIEANLPAALWGAGTGGPQLGSAVVPGLIVGAAGSAPTPALPTAVTLPGGTGVLLIDQLTDRQASPLGWSPVDGHAATVAGDTRVTIARGIATTLVNARAAVVSVLNSSGIGTGLEAGTLTTLATEIDAALSVPPIIGPLGSTGPTAPPFPPPPSPPPPPPPASTRAPTTASPADMNLLLLTGTASHESRTPKIRALFREDRPPVANRAPRHVSFVADEWSHTQELRCMARSVSGSRRTPRTRLQKGASAVWDITTDGLSLCCNEQPLWIVALDAGQDVAMSWFGSPQEPLAIPGRTTRVAVTASDLPSSTGPIGWRRDTILRQVAPRVLLGDGIVVRRQSPSVIRHGRYRREVGTVAPWVMTAANLTMDRDGNAVPGYVDTLFPRAIVSIGVVLSSEGGNAGARPTEPAVAIHEGRHGTLRALDPVASRIEDAETTWGVRLDDMSPEAPLWIRVTAPPGWQLREVFAPQVGSDRAAQAAPARPGRDGPKLEVWWQ